MLRGYLDDALEGHGRVLLVSGEAGIGKTTLVEDLAWEAAERGLLVLTGRCYDLSVTPPFGPWLEIIGQASGEPTVAPAPSGHDGVVSAQVLEWLLNEAGERPLMLILDDFHWADQASHDLLRLFARRVAELPVLLAVTYRSEEVQRRHPLYTLLPLLVRESGAGRTELRRLTDDAVAEWVAARYQLNGSDLTRLVTFLQRNAEGNPFFVGELLRTMEDDGVLALSAGGWRLRALDDAEIPLLLRQVVEMRLGRLAEDDRRLVTVAAIIGQDVAFDTWAGLADAPEEAVYQAVEAAAEAGLMLPATGAIDRAHFNHALTRAALYDELSPLERRRLHLRAADLLVADGGRNPDAIAFHLLQAGDLRAVEWQIEAGDRAWRSAARLAAAERYEVARELLETRGDDDGQLPWLYYRLAESYRLAQPQRALDYLERAELLAQAPGDQALVAWARWSRGLTLCLIDDPRGLEELLAGAQALDALSMAAQAEVWEPLRMAAGSHQGDLTAWLAALGRYGEAIEQSDRYLEQVSSGPVVLARTVADAHFGRGVAFTALGQPEPARQAFIEAMRRFQAQRHHYMAGVTAWEHLLMTLTYHADQVAERRRIAELAVAEWSRASDAMLALEPRLGRLGRGAQCRGSRLAQ
jgi:tetratricopeptide (TPR) repeat protein